MEAIAKYCWNLELSEALLPCLHAAEISLRNGIHRAMVAKYLPASTPHFPNGEHPDEWWFNCSTKLGDILDSRDYEQVQRASDKVREGNKRLTTPRVVAELSFGFWVDLLNKEYETTVVRPLLGSTFRKLTQGERSQVWLKRTFSEFRDLRNRVSHHEPIYQREDLPALNRLAWDIVKQVNPGFGQVTSRSCRFDAVWTKTWRPSYEALVRDAKRLYETYR